MKNLPVMKTKTNLSYNILRIIFLSLSALLLIFFCLVVIKISYAASGSFNNGATSHRMPTTKLPLTDQQEPRSVSEKQSVVDEMLSKPNFWIEYINNAIKEENGGKPANTASIDKMTKEKNYWLQEMNTFIQQEDHPSPNNILRDI
jgi:hypothetical protein